MAGPVLYSTNPWITYDIVTRYRGGKFFVWCSDYFDHAMAPPGSAAAQVAPSSSPKRIYESLYRDFKGEDNHSSLIQGYRKTFKRLATAWESEGAINDEQRKEIIATINSNSWKIWRPMLFVIPHALIVPADRLKLVPHGKRAAYGPEMQIADLQLVEFDAIEVAL